MNRRNRWLVRALGCAAVAALALSLAPVSSATCSGTMYIYYQTAAKTTETGAKLVCPTGVYYDLPADGSYQETPYFDTVPMDCPCSGGGGGGGGGNDEDAPPG